MPTLRDERPDLPDCLDDVLKRASAIHPDDRFETIAAPRGQGLGESLRTIKLSLRNVGEATVDVDNVRLFAEDGRDLIDSGSFAGGLDHWTFTADNHLAWHAKSLPLAILFDQGLLGLVSTAALLSLALWRAGRQAIQGQLELAAVFSALVGFLVVGVFDTLIDAPRFLLLWLLLALIAASMQRQRAAHSFPQTKGRTKADRNA